MPAKGNENLELLPAKQMGEKRGKFQNVVEIAHKVVVQY